MAAASEGFDDIVKLVKSGVGTEVVLAYVDASPVAYDLSVDEILYLNDLGVTSGVLKAIVAHGKAVRASADAEPMSPRGLVEEASGPGVVPPRPPVDMEAEPDGAVTDGAELPVQGRPQAEYSSAPAVPSRPSAPQAPAQPPAPARYAEPDAAADSQLEIVPQPSREVVREVVVERPARTVIVERPATTVVVEEAAVVSPMTVVAPPPDQVNISFFYESLSPYGTWVSIDNEWYWQPTVAVSDVAWRPYGNSGHWVYTDCGWAWQSDYSWGWAPFHYGRWTHHGRHGWIWAPDTVWAPAWVSWRTCDTHYAWAPLPPAARYETGAGFRYQGKHVSADFEFGLTERDYMYVPAERICETRLTPYSIEPVRANTIYQQTVIVQNNYTFVDNRVIVHGPSADHVRRTTHRDLTAVRIVDADIRPGQPIRGSGPSKDGLAFYRPHVKSAAPETPLAVQARRDAALQRQEEARQTAAARKEERRQKEADEKAAHLQRLDARRDAAEQRKLDTIQRRETVDAAEAQLRARREAERQKAADIKRQQAEADKAAHVQRLEDRRDAADQQKQAAEKRRLEADAAEALQRAQQQAGRQKALELRRQQDAAEEAARQQKLIEQRQAAEQRRAASDAAEQQRQAERQKLLDARRQQDAQEKAARDAQEQADKLARQQALEARRQRDADAKAARDAEAKARKDARAQPQPDAQPDSNPQKKDRKRHSPGDDVSAGT